MQYNLSKFTEEEEELCKIYSSLNRWEWNVLLGEKPNGWDQAPDFYKSFLKGKLLNSKYKMIIPIMNDIEKKVGRTKLLEWHWLNNLKRTKEEFRNWLFKEMSDRHLRL